MLTGLFGDEAYSKFEKTLKKEGKLVVILDGDEASYCTKDYLEKGSQEIREMLKQGAQIYLIDRSEIPVEDMLGYEVEKYCNNSLFPDLRDKYKVMKLGY